MNIKYLYLRDRFGKNLGVVAYDVKGRGVGSISYGVSLCNVSMDSFSKEVGKTIAVERLASSPKLLDVAANSDTLDIVTALLTKISRNGNLPSKARKIARKTLNTKYK